MTDFIIILILLAILAGAGWYIYKAKKSGQKCIGCPSAKTCGSSTSSGCSGNCSGCSGVCGCSGKNE